MNDDAALLREYAGNRSEAAFTELVRRHVDLVYATALRRTDGNAHLAADVSQQVFTELARRAGQLAHYAVLAAWLHTATRNAAINLMISEKRRRVRETEAVTAAGDTAPAEPAPDWDRVRPLLDTAIDELPEQDRTAVVLRFLEHKSFAAIGAALRVSEDAARMRTDRALDKLRAGLARRGFTSSASALAALVAGQPLVSAPTGLAALLVSQALAPAAAGLAVPTVFTFMNAKLATTAVVAAAAFFLLGRYASPTARVAPPVATVVVTPTPADDSQRILAQLRAENAELRADVDRLTGAAKDLLDKLAAPAPATAVVTESDEAAQQRQAVLNNLRRLAAAADQFRFSQGRPPTSLADIVGPNKYVKSIEAVAGEDYSQLSFSAEEWVVTLPNGTTVSYLIGKQSAPDQSGTPAVPDSSRGKGAAPAAGIPVERPPGVSRPETVTVIGRDGAVTLQVTPEIRKAMELRQKVQPAMTKAIQAYEALHGKVPPTPDDLAASFFENPQDAVDYAEALRVAREVGIMPR